MLGPSRLGLPLPFVGEVGHGTGALAVVVAVQQAGNDFVAEACGPSQGVERLFVFPGIENRLEGQDAVSGFHQMKRFVLDVGHVGAVQEVVAVFLTELIAGAHDVS